MMEGLCVGIPVAIFVVNMIVGFNSFFAPNSPSGFPVPTDLVLAHLNDFSILMYGGVSGVLLVCGITLVLVRGRHVIYYQWFFFWSYRFSFFFFVLKIIFFFPLGDLLLLEVFGS